MLFRKLEIRSSSSFLGFALAGLLAAGLAASPARAATTTYDTNNTPYTGGTISAGDTVLLNDGATVTGPTITDNGTLQFNQTGALTISNTISGTGELSLTNTGTLTLAGLSGTSYGQLGVLMNMTTSASAGTLSTGTAPFYVGSGTVNVASGIIKTSGSYCAFGSEAGGVGTLNVSSGTFNSTGSIDTSFGGKGLGTLNVSGGNFTSGPFQLGGAGFAGASSATTGTGVATITGGTFTQTSNFYMGFYGTGTMNVQGGYVSVGATSVGFNGTGKGTINVSSGTFMSSSSLTLGVGASNIGVLNITGGLVAVTGSITIGGNGSGINLTGGTLQLISRSGTTSFANNATLKLSPSLSGTYSGVFSGTGALVKDGAGATYLSAANTYSGGTTIDSGILLLGSGVNGSTAGSIAGNVLINSGTLQFNRSNAYSFNGIISGYGAVRKTGTAGTTTLSGSNSYTGGTTITAGMLTLGNTNALGSGPLTLATSSTLNLATFSPTVRALSGTAGVITTASAAAVTLTSTASTDSSYGGQILNGSGTVAFAKQGSGVLTLTGSNGYTGRTQVDGGTLALGNTNALFGTGTISFGGGSLRYSGSNTVDYSAKILNSGSAIAIDTNGQSVTFATGLGSSNTGGLTKSGSGKLTFSGSNAYSGLTTISAGTVALSGTGSIGTGSLNLGTTGSPGVFDLVALTAGTYSLPSSASLAGVGTLSGSSKTLVVLGSLAPGNSAGTITVGSGLSLDLSQSGTSVFEITDPAYTAGTYDLVDGNGSVVFGGVLSLVFSGGTYANGFSVDQIFTNTGGRSGNFSAVNATGLAAGQSATFDPVTGYITVVPEPSTCASLLAGAGLAGLMRWRKRRAAQAAA